MYILLITIFNNFRYDKLYIRISPVTIAEIRSRYNPHHSEARECSIDGRHPVKRQTVKNCKRIESKTNLFTTYPVF